MNSTLFFGVGFVVIILALVEGGVLEAETGRSFAIHELIAVAAVSIAAISDRITPARMATRPACCAA